MARTQVNYSGDAEALRTVSAPKIAAVQARFDPRGSKGFQLAEALGAAGPAIEQLDKKIQQNQERDQLLKLDAYKARFMQDFKGGAVTQAQLKEVFPELVPTVRARVMEAIGAEQGKKAIQGIIEEINNNDELKLDSTRRQSFLAEKRNELLGQLGSGDDFALAGMVKSIDTELNQWENSWQRDTAKYHEQVQGQAFSDEVISTLRNGGNLEDVDAKWKASSSLNNIERNKLVIDSVTKEAFASNDPGLLDKIPQRFLNAETKAELQQARLRVEEVRISKLRQAEFERTQARQEATRSAKVQMIRAKAAGQAISPESFLNDPDAYTFALQMQNSGNISGFQSAANAQKVRIGILDNATMANLDPNQVIDSIAANPNINPAEKEKLINEVPALMEGRIVLNDPMVKNAFSTQLNARFDLLEKSLPGVLSSTTQGRSLRADAQRAYELDLRGRFQAFYEENGRWPTGQAKQDIIDKATDRAGQNIEKSISAIMRGGAPAAATPAAQPQPTPQLPKVTSDAEYNALPSGAQFIDPNGVTRRKP